MIAILNFDMPIECDSCPFYMFHADKEDDCCITGEGLYHVKFGERHEKCPLVDLKSENEETYCERELCSRHTKREDCPANEGVK